MTFPLRDSLPARLKKRNHARLVINSATSSAVATLFDDRPISLLGNNVIADETFSFSLGDSYSYMGGQIFWASIFNDVYNVEEASLHGYHVY